MPSALLDADVILDLFVNREPHHADALRLFSRLRRCKIRCATSPVVIANVYYILTRLKSKRYALGRLARLRKLVDVPPVDSAVIDAALLNPSRDFEDSIQYQCALAGEFRTLITRNTCDYPKGALPVVTPRQYLDMLGVTHAFGLPGATSVRTFLINAALRESRRVLGAGGQQA